MSVEMFKLFIAEDYEEEEHVLEQIFEQWTMFSSLIEHGTIEVQGNLSDECVTLVFPDTISVNGHPLYGIDVDKDIIEPGQWSKMERLIRQVRKVK
tara:strand:- start:589 stop:876 length:288 start_codon:yes stop_codon:yes gene_type:complete